MGGVGRIQEFDVKSGKTVYCERIEMYFLANKIEDNLKLPTLIAVMGEEAYQLLSTLSSPQKPSTLTYEVAVTLMKNHLQPKPSILARYLFRQRRQANGESVADYITELKRLAKPCDFGSTLEENLRDQIVCGITSETTRQAGHASGSDRNADTYWVHQHGGGGTGEDNYDDGCYASIPGVDDKESDDEDDEQPMYQMSISKYRPA